MDSVRRAILEAAADLRRWESADYKRLNELRNSIHTAAQIAGEVVVYGSDASPEVRRSAAAALEVLTGLVRALERENARALGALRSGARVARKHHVDRTDHIPTSRRMFNIVRARVKEVITRVGPPGGILARDLALDIIVYFALYTPTPDLEVWKAKTSEGADAVARSIPARFRSGNRVFVPWRPHLVSAPRKREALCRCPDCAADAIMRAAVLATGLPVDAPTKKRTPKK